MEKLNKIIEELVKIGDITVDIETKGQVDITIEDFEGFDENWEEVNRDYVNPDKISELVNYLEENGTDKVEELYKWYTIDNTRICLGYSSFDI